MKAKKYPMLEKGAKAAIDYAKKEKGGICITTVDGFLSDQEATHLRDLLWYARDNGVEVDFVPEK